MSDADRTINPATDHVCGLQGFGHSLDDECPACKARFNTTASASGQAGELTRERLAAARDWLARFVADSRGTADEHYAVLLAATERLLAMKPASDEEIESATAAWWDSDEPDYEGATNSYEPAWRECERRLLPFTDETTSEVGE